MCLATSEETRIFSNSNYRYYVPSTINRIVMDSNVWITLDPAYSQASTASYRVILVNAVDLDNNWFLADIPYGRWNPDELIDQLFKSVIAWKPKSVGIEKGLYKNVIEPFIYKEMSKRNVFFNIVEIEHAKRGSKLERVKMLAPRFKAHSIWFPQEASWLSELEMELAGVTKDGFKSLFVDLIDTLAMQEQIANAPYGKEKMQSLPRVAIMDSPFAIQSTQGFERLARSVQTNTKV